MYRVDSTAATQEISAYKSLAQFFTRDIKAELRPLGAGVLLSPVDGVLRSYGQVKDGVICDVKGQNYTVAELLGDDSWGAEFTQSCFFNFYLSPRDCHHVFCPVEGKVSRISNIPGALWPVNDLGLTFIPKLFVKNERVAFGLESALGPLVLVMVGALNVGKMEVLCRSGQELQKGQKMGTFWLGSSVILLCQNTLKPCELTPPLAVIFGESILT